MGCVGIEVDEIEVGLELNQLLLGGGGGWQTCQKGSGWQLCCLYYCGCCSVG